MSLTREERIGIIGNMNNNGFAIMRYFRDLGVDAHLLPFSTDSIHNLEHFRPEADTWNIDYWRKYIHALPIPNTSEAVFGKPKRLIRPPSQKLLSDCFKGYSHLIGSGISPAVLQRINRSLDVFFPYGIGIEFYGDIEFKNRRNISVAHRLFYNRLMALQGTGIKQAKYCFNAELSLTKKSFEHIGKQFECLSIPMVYNREEYEVANLSDHAKRAIKAFRAADLSLFSCARQLWVNDRGMSSDDWKMHTKNSDWLIRGLGAFVNDNPDANILLGLVDYGPDVSATKSLISQLGLEENIIWLPKMMRKEILCLLANVKIGVGEFYTTRGTIWGGTGWEVLSSGRPLMQSFNFTKEEFLDNFGYLPPPILDVKSPEDVTKHLETLYQQPKQLNALGVASESWFNKNAGIGLAQQWLDTAFNLGFDKR